ncbi:hypothetical protein BS17DRAFT_769693 [Gyrodon lividus]|nr:hypothetical protein BS17DRAFT_769693 [Gyrodon lividus]
MFGASRGSVRKGNRSLSTDDHPSTRDQPRELLPPQPYTRELSISSHSLRTTDSHHDDLPIIAPPSHIPSTHSSPVTSPSTGYGSHFASSHSSVTSESSPGADTRHRSEFGVLAPGSPYTHSPIHESVSSRSSHLPSPGSRSTTESDIHSPASRPLRKYPSGRFCSRPSTAPHSLSTPASKGESIPGDHQSRTHDKTPTRLSLGIKNLLSKPARIPLPSPSRFSFHSTTTTPTDNEASSRSRNATVMRMTTPQKWRPNLDVPECPSATPTPSPSSPPMDAHRRYASETAKVYSSALGYAPPTSQECLDVSTHGVLRPSRGRDQKPRNVLRRRPSGSAKLTKEHNRGRGPTDQNGPALPLDHDEAPSTPSRDGKSRGGAAPLLLTPAGAVVEAYKQQALRREDASAHDQSVDTQGLGASPEISQDGGEGGTPARSPVPYYTVLGTSSGRRVAAGGPEDRWSRFEGHLPDQRPWISAETPPQADAGSRSLTRKVSSRWRKVTGGGVAPEESPSRSDVGHSKGRPSLQEVRSGRSKERGRFAGRSMDCIADLREEVWAGPLAGYGRPGMEQGSEKAETLGKEAGEGGKLWRLVKRISTGGLRERFQVADKVDKAVPPVPAIPKELLEQVNQAVRNDNSPETTRRRPSSARRSSRHRQSESSHEKHGGASLTRPPTAPKNIPGPRPGFATASSSPNSSDVASAQFFQKTHSARSSLSSYGEAGVPPVPEIALDRHIIAPLEQLRLGGDHVVLGRVASRSRSPRRAISVPAGLHSMDCTNSDQPLPSSSSKACHGDTRTMPPLTPTPANSNSTKQKSESSHNSTAWSPLADGGVSLSPPPPRPSRSTRRGTGPTSPSRNSVKDGDEGVAEAPKLDRASPSAQSDASTAKPRPRSNSLTLQPAITSDSPHSRSQLTFREMDAPRRPPLSEREKADIWDDLLARSDKAGGTLHLGVGELMSDNMRFSTYSEMS